MQALNLYCNRHVAGLIFPASLDVFIILNVLKNELFLILMLNMLNDVENVLIYIYVNYHIVTEDQRKLCW